MIVQTRENKDLVIPKSLGNFVTEGSGGGITPEEAAEIASAVTEEAISEYDTELQVDLEDIRDAVSGNSEDISALSGVTETISQQIGSLSGLTDDIAAISGQTSANTQDIGTLSGDVETNALAIANLENNVVPDLQEGTAAAGGLAESANTKVEALSASTVALSQTVAGKQDALTAGNGISISGTTISVKAGEGLGFSGDTLVVSGATGGGPTNYYLNDMSQQELADLYDMIAELTEYDTDSSNIPYIFENYRFFAHTADIDGQQYVQLFFSNWEEREGDYQLWIGGMLPTKASYPVNIHRTIAIILSDGTLQMNDSDLSNIDDAANDLQIRINSNGYIASDVLDYFSSLAKFNRFVFVYQDENITNNYCAAPLKYFYRKNEMVNDEEKLMEYIGVEININGTWYKGDWHFAEFEWSEWNAPDTWTTI